MKKIAALAFTAYLMTACIQIVMHDPVQEAFFNLDKGIKHTNEVVDSNLIENLAEIEKKSNENPLLKPISDSAQTLKTKIAPLIAKVAELRSAISNEGGFYLYDGEYHGEDRKTRQEKYEADGYTNFVKTDDIKLEAKPVDKKNKDIPQRILVEEGKGGELKNTINATRLVLLRMVDDLVAAQQANPIEGVNFDEKAVERLKDDLVLEEQTDEMAKENGKASWEAHIFGYMPVAACYPLLRKFENDGKNATVQVTNFLVASVNAK